MSEIGCIQSGNYIDRLVSKVNTPRHQWLCRLIASHSKISFILDCYDLLWLLCLDYVDPPQPPTFAATSRILRSSGFFIFGFKPWTTNNEQVQQLQYPRCHNQMTIQNSHDSHDSHDLNTEAWRSKESHLVCNHSSTHSWHLGCQALPMSVRHLCLSKNRCHHSRSLSRLARFAEGPALRKLSQ